MYNRPNVNRRVFRSAHKIDYKRERGTYVVSKNGLKTDSG